MFHLAILAKIGKAYVAENPKLHHKFEVYRLSRGDNIVTRVSPLGLHRRGAICCQREVSIGADEKRDHEEIGFKAAVCDSAVM